MSNILATIGTEISTIDVKVSYRIIQLFSEGLYRSPNKAVEELVSNSFDAGANHVHVIISPDLVSDDASIAVLDDGTGMDEFGLEQHWLIGVSNKREETYKPPKGRKQIGKFGIGKLATFVLANRLTHITKCNGKYLSTSMDFASIPSGEHGEIYVGEPVKIPLRELTRKDASQALITWTSGDKPGFSKLRLFGKDSPSTWTLAILSDLKPMATEIRPGRLKWILQTAMPLRDDFELYLNGDLIVPSKFKVKKVGKWIFGKSLKRVPRPAPDDLQSIEDPSVDKKSTHRYGWTHPILGRITGYAEAYEDLLTGGKSSVTERSHGFFVYVCERLINIDDEYFGIDRNLLRHGTFSRFRMVVHIDRLDEELRSSRETVRMGELSNIARNVLHGVFNYVRSKHEEHVRSESVGAQLADRVASSPKSLTARPIIAVVSKAIAGQLSPKYVEYPRSLPQAQADDFLADLRKKSDTEGIVRTVELSDDLGSDEVVAKLDAERRLLKINGMHPFVAQFRDAYEADLPGLPLMLLAMSEILMEATLYLSGLAESRVHDIMSQRDELLRNLARSTGKRNVFLIAQDLVDASSDKYRLEIELVAAFDCMGFDAVPMATVGKPDGVAVAILPAHQPGRAERYKVSLEAKSKERSGAKVSAKSVDVAAIARHRNEQGCDHAVVVGPDFPTTKGDKSALKKDIETDRKNTENTEETAKTITLIRIIDLAKLVRIVPARQLGLAEIRDLFINCTTPEESAAWISDISRKKVKRPPYREILETIREEQGQDPTEIVEYGSLRTALRRSRGIQMSTEDIMGICRALARMAPGYVFALENCVELNQRPDIVLDAIEATIRQYPEDEQRDIPFLGNSGSV